MFECWAEAPIQIARMTLTIKLDRDWNSFQLANRAPPLSVIDSAIAPSARMDQRQRNPKVVFLRKATVCLRSAHGVALQVPPEITHLELGSEDSSKIEEVTLMRPIHGNL